MRKYDFVLLDADMTLLDFERSEREALRRVLADAGIEPTEQVCADYSKINDALWQAFARGEVDQDFLTVERFAALLRLYGPGNQSPAALSRAYEHALGEEAHLLPGALDFCRELKRRGYRLAIATNGLPVPQRGRWTRTGLDQVIPALFISMELGVQKPLPAYFDKVCAALGITDRRRAVMVGDSLTSDIRGGQDAGLDTIWFNPKGLPLTGPAAPTYTAGSYEDVLAILT